MAGMHDKSGNSSGKKDRFQRIMGILVVCAIAVFVIAAILERIELPERPKKPAAEESGQTSLAGEVADQQTGQDGISGAQTQQPDDQTGTGSEETDPEPIVKENTATIGAVGDVLLHDETIKSGYDKETDSYNYDGIYKWFSKYIEPLDYAVANLEVTLCTDKMGYPYAGYPCFNSPDAIVDAVKNAGFDMLLTANNHANDTGSKGFMRTQEVIVDRGLEHIGTRLEQEDKNYVIKDLNGIQVGMICYTYSSGLSNAGHFMLNNSPLTAETSPLINAFTYGNLSAFYDKLSGEMEQMRAEGAEAIVLFIHWGKEYITTPSDTQKDMAQELCNLGIDVIVGNHAHVVQPVELLTNETDETRRTLCLYSLGNSISNFFKTATFPVHTEDGMLFSFTFAEYSDGTVLLESADIMPTWVYRPVEDDGVRRFYIMTLDDELEDWQTAMETDDETLVLCEESYARTTEIVSESLAEANEWLSQHQAEVEAALGVVPAA